MQNLLVIIVLTFLTGLGDPGQLSGGPIMQGLGISSANDSSNPQNTDIDDQKPSL